MSILRWQSRNEVTNLGTGVGYSIEAYATSIRKQVALVRTVGGEGVIVAYFRSDDDARRCADEILGGVVEVAP